VNYFVIGNGAQGEEQTKYGSVVLKMIFCCFVLICYVMLFCIYSWFCLFVVYLLVYSIALFIIINSLTNRHKSDVPDGISKYAYPTSWEQVAGCWSSDFDKLKCLGYGIFEISPKTATITMYQSNGNGQKLHSVTIDNVRSK